MNELVSSMLVIGIILCGLSLTLSPLIRGKPDAFMLLRPGGRFILPLPARITGGISRLLHRGARRLWRAAPHQSVLLRIPMYPLAAVLALSGGFFSAVAAICGEIFRPPKRRK